MRAWVSGETTGEENEQERDTVHIQSSQLDLCSPSLSLHVGGHVDDVPSIFHLQHDSPPTKHRDEPWKLLGRYCVKILRQ